MNGRYRRRNRTRLTALSGELGLTLTVTSTLTLQTLEARVREDPYDDGRWLVLEDYLLETEDPRAAIVRCEQAGLRREAAAARNAVTPPLLGPQHAAVAERVVGVWRAGYLVDVALNLPYDRHAPSAELVAPLVASPAAAVLRAMTVALDAAATAPRALAAIAASPCATSLRSLTVQASWTPARSAPTLSIGGIALRRLFLTGRPMRLAVEPALATLTSLMVSPPDDDELAALLAKPLPALYDLGVAGPVSLDGFAPLFTGDVTPSLANLQIRNPVLPLARALLSALATSPLLPRLRTLALGDTRVAPASRGPAFAHLDVLALPAALAKA